MNRSMLFSSLLLLLCALAGCKHEPASTTIICLLDTSKSIDPAAVQEEFIAMDRFVDGMHRGDTLIVIPITGNARNDVQGHILRLEAPLRRESFDADLNAFHKTAYGEIASLAAWAAANPSAKTDILGTLKVAEQEDEGRNHSTVRMVILSDFIEDDGALNFGKDARLASSGKARKLAAKLAVSEKIPFDSVYLGRVRGDTGSLPRTRQDAIDAFWNGYFSRPGRPVSIHDDGDNALNGARIEGK